jgi:beta-galactosidase GanA
MDTSSKGKRQAIIDKVVSSILNRIITEKPSKKTKKEITRQIKKKSEKKINLSENKNKFIYNIIDGNNQTTTHTIPVKNSNFIVNRIIELTQEVSNNQSET